MRSKLLLHVLRPLVIAFGLLLITALSLVYVHQVSQAQSGPITITKRLNRSSNVVRVGEVLSFTIAITNNSSFTLSNVTLVDTYDNTTLAFAGSTPQYDDQNPGTGVITWNNIAVPPIPPLQTIRVTVSFTAEHPKTTVVNFARAQDLQSSSGTLTQTAETSQTQESIGGAAPVFKALSPPDTAPMAGLPLTFTHIITNDGAAIMTYLPLTDTYDPAFLDFNFAVPTPTIISSGLLVWTDLTTYFGDILPFNTVVVTTVFTATTRVINTVNWASTQGAIDEYNNDLTAGEALVPITIIDVPTATPTSTPKEDSPQPTPTPFPTLTPSPTVTATALFPTTLPETGASYERWPLVFAGLLLALGGGALVKRLGFI